jgi:DNA-binding NarL/FixJ family response regulator
MDQVYHWNFGISIRIFNEVVFGSSLAVEAMRLGAIAYLRKPFDDECLLNAIQLALEKGT